MKQDWEKLAFIKASKYREEILKALAQPRTPTEVAKITGKNIAHVSRTLKELQKRGFVRCLTPKARKGKLYKRIHKL